YPLLSNLLHEGGTILLHYDVSVSGTVSGVGMEQSSGNERLDRAGVICVSRHWRNTPAIANGVAVASPHHLARVIFVPYTFAPSELVYGNTLTGLGRYADAVAELR